jgi:hypothetical protein
MNTTKNRALKLQSVFILFVATGVSLLIVTIGAVSLLQNTADSALFGWLSLSALSVGTGIGALGLLIATLTADFLWLLSFILWILRRKLHVEKTDRTLRLP